MSQPKRGNCTLYSRAHFEQEQLRFKSENLGETNHVITPALVKPEQDTVHPIPLISSPAIPISTSEDISLFYFEILK
ncbi:hypothetical protein H6G76_00155 [Nostoc sp. FACHB-152]|uniref:hypothetical protein n=1 Tax=unclassified Nostoc TaxID=2593658 RepID=UPI0016841584|nr:MULTISPECIES: hypothetical protein [unclassified Nostoc]MBD2445583.1 hypothetical protein [Nostoc sp. FACHB-152]MBD2466695.1 hypothetical protein [Nostoc sp. FACHB-145]